jgi:hypothetical protein
MRIVNIFLILLFLGINNSYGQFIIPGEGLMDVKIGSDWDEIEWELGFRGEKIEKMNAISSLKLLADQSEIDFDFIVSYQHIMWLPVSDLFFKDNKVCMIQISSYPEYYKMLCMDIGTVEGLNFWDEEIRVQEIYGNSRALKIDEKAYYAFNEKGLGVEILNNEVRTMVIFQAQME